MGRRRLFVSFIVFCLLAFTGTAFAEESGFAKEFGKAFDANDEQRMALLVEMKKDSVPEEIQALIDEAMNKEVNKEDRSSILYIAEVMANHYKEIANNFEPLKAVKRATFNSQLSDAVRSVPQGGVHIIEMPMRTDTVMNKFTPDNIIIKKGETVRWINRDSEAHIFSSMPFLGEGAMLSPMVESGKSWERTLDTPGEYFYLCFIHAGMVGKITVEE
ncbi:MAG: plastocyanin/azurin family copper-binding protein [Thermodesulfobacteriota bacterium]